MQVVDQVIQTLRNIAQTEVMPRFLRVESTRKSDGTLFTEADLATQQALARCLPEILPYPVLGEEMTPDEQHALWDANPDGLWVVDPIDGTTNFIHGLPYFAISVALMRQGRSELGVIYNPVSNEMFYARPIQRLHSAHPLARQASPICQPAPISQHPRPCPTPQPLKKPPRHPHNSRPPHCRKPSS